MLIDFSFSRFWSTTKDRIWTELGQGWRLGYVYKISLSFNNNATLGAISPDGDLQWNTATYDSLWLRMTIWSDRKEQWYSWKLSTRPEIFSLRSVSRYTQLSTPPSRRPRIPHHDLCACRDFVDCTVQSMWGPLGGIGLTNLRTRW